MNKQHTKTNQTTTLDANPYPAPTFLADELDQVTGELGQKIEKIGEMVNAIRDHHEKRTRAGIETDAENASTREVLAGALALLEKCEPAVDAAAKWTGADCLA